MNKKNSLFIGLILTLIFAAVLVALFSPIFGGVNGLDFADNLFNKLSKGSSYFIPKLEESNKEFAGKAINVTVKLDNIEKTVAVLEKTDMEIKVEDSSLTPSGDPGSFESTITKDADLMYQNKGDEVTQRYGMDGKEVLRTWYSLLKAMDYKLKQEQKIKEANLLSEVSKRGIEAAYNFYGIESQKVSDKAGIMTGLLVFYVIYTMLWGFAIFYIFEAIGLSMSKKTVKKEV